MLIAEIKINGKAIALIQARNVMKLTDLYGDRVSPTVRRYNVEVFTDRRPELIGAPAHQMQIDHDRRFGWQGLLHAITGEIMPTVVETLSEGDRFEHPSLGPCKVANDKGAFVTD